MSVLQGDTGQSKVFPVLHPGVTETSGIEIPALIKADEAYARVADVQIAQQGFGRRQ